MRDGEGVSLFSVEAEQAIIGTVLLTNEAVDQLPPGFGADWFADPVHQRIWAIVEKRLQEGTLASPVTIKNALTDDDGLARLGGAAYLSRLAGSVISTSALKPYAMHVRDLWVRRTAIQSLADAQGALSDLSAEKPAHEALEAAQSALMVLAEGASPKPIVHGLTDALQVAMERTAEAYRHDGKPLVSTGLAKLDDSIGGLFDGDHIVLMGESSMGKTALAISIALRVARQGYGVFFASLEMQSYQIAYRLVSALAAEDGDKIEYRNLLRGRLSEDEFRRALETALGAEGLPIIFAENDCSTLPRLINAAQAARRRFQSRGIQMGLMVVDYLQQVDVPGSKSDTQRVSTAARAMKTVAKLLNCACVSLSQMNRDNSDRARKDKRPRKSDARQSGEIEEAADVMIGVYRHAYHLERDIKGMDSAEEKSEAIALLANIRHEVEAIILKQRQGAIETVNLWADLPINLFLDEPPLSHRNQEAMEF